MALPRALDLKGPTSGLLSSSRGVVPLQRTIADTTRSTSLIVPRRRRGPAVQAAVAVEAPDPVLPSPQDLSQSFAPLSSSQRHTE